VREKLIYDGRLDARVEDVQAIVDQFLFENFALPLDGTPNLQIKIEKRGNKQIHTIFPQLNKDSGKIINGYIEINQIYLDDDHLVDVRIVSCRPELDLLFFQLSQKVQARFIIPNFPPDVLTIPWRDLMEQGFINSKKIEVDDSLEEDQLNPDEIVERFGTDRNLTKNAVRRYVKQCRTFQNKGGTVKGYYITLGVFPPFSYETLRSWLKNPDFSE
jgi:hypothetical protein